MKQQLYFPSTIAEQIQWLVRFQAEFPAAAARLALAPGLIADTLRDLEWLLHGLRGLRAPLEYLTKAVPAYNKVLQTGAGAEPLVLPQLVFPDPPAGKPPSPGALKRVFNVVRVLKNSPGYDEAIGRLLGVEANHFPEADSPYPTFSLKIIPGEAQGIVEGRFRRYGRPGVWVESQRGEEDWQPVEDRHQTGVFCRSTFRDARPLLQSQQPEYRHYRMRFWDGKPFGEWSPVAKIVVGS